MEGYGPTKTRKRYLGMLVWRNLLRKEKAAVIHWEGHQAIDENGTVEAFQIDCLKPRVGTGTVLDGIPSHLPRDLEIFPISNIISEPLRMIPLKGNRWDVPDYNNLEAFFKEVIKIDREAVRTCER